MMMMMMMRRRRRRRKKMRRMMTIATTTILTMTMMMTMMVVVVVLLMMVVVMLMPTDCLQYDYDSDYDHHDDDGDADWLVDWLIYQLDWFIHWLRMDCLDRKALMMKPMMLDEAIFCNNALPQVAWSEVPYYPATFLLHKNGESLAVKKPHRNSTSPSPRSPFIQGASY